jgi:hypothetical protein
MAARKKTPAKRTAPIPAKKTAPKTAPARKAAAAKPAPVAAKSAAAAARPAAKKVAPKKESSAGSAVEALAKRIVKVTISADPGSFSPEDLYTPDCVSYESRGEGAVGFEGLAEKNKVWASMQKRSTWTPLNVAIKGNTILIEWSAEVELRDGRTVTLREVAVYGTRGGSKITGS